MFRSLAVTILGLVGLIGLLGGVKALQISDLIEGMAAAGMPPSTVSTVKAEEQEWEVTLNSVGTIEAVQGVIISADLPGRVASIEFQPGAEVKAGDVLIRQDVSSEQAQLRAARANTELAQANLERLKELVGKKVASQSELDTADARYKEAVAQAENIQTSIDKKTIVAPFDGKLGIRLVNLGQDLASGTSIVSLQAVDTLFVNFSLPQQDLQHLEPGIPVRIEADAVAGEIFNGSISAIDPRVDPATRSVQVQASFKNIERKLLPGMFANVEVVLPEMERVIAVPKTAVAFATFGDSVFVVEKSQAEDGQEQLVANQQFVQLGRSKGDYVAISKGLEVGQDVVSSGVFKLQNGAPVAINNDVMPQFSLTPTPEDT